MKVYWYSGNLVVVDSFPELEKMLTITKKSLDWNASKFRRETRKYKERLFTVMYEGPENRTIMTLQGFKDKILKLGKKHNKDIEFYDCRMKLPDPTMSLAGGFRHNQEELFTQLLTSNSSGLLKAPTRYGKTIMMVNAMRVFPNVPTVLAAPGVDLLTQLVSELKQWLPEREVKGIFTGSRNKIQSDDITVCSFDSLQKLNADNVKLLLIDEPHAAVSESRAPLLARFKNARIYGFGATLRGRYDGADDLITGLIGPILASRSFKEAVEEGAVCPITVYFLKVPFDPWVCSDRNHAYKKLLYKNESFFELVREISSRHIPEDWQSLLFIDQKQQADIMSRFVSGSEVAIAGRMSKKDRKELFDRVANNETKRCICTNIYAQGVTFPELRVMVNAAGGGGSISSIQKPGRLAQVRENKKCGYLVDFLFEPTQDPNENRDIPLDAKHLMWQQVVRDGFARMRTYSNMGYNVNVIDSVNQLNFE